MKYQTLDYTKKDHIAYIEIKTLEAEFAVSQQMAQELKALSTEISADEDIYVVLVTGGPATGSRAMAAEPGLYSAGKAIAGIKQPVIFAIGGDAVGAYLELALAGDIRLAADSSKFGFPEVTDGQMPSDGGTQRLPRIVGKGKAMEMLLTGEIVDARTALDIGLVHRVVPADKLAAEVEAMAKTVTTRAPLSLKYVKEAINQGLELTLEQGLHLEADLYFLLHTTGDRTEGIRAYLEKRTAEFKGK